MMRCRVFSGSGYVEASPLRRGSPWCQFHRKRCWGTTLAGNRCYITSSSQNTHADPLRDGGRFCAHHSANASAAASSTPGAADGTPAIPETPAVAVVPPTVVPPPMTPPGSPVDAAVMPACASDATADAPAAPVLSLYAGSPHHGPPGPCPELRTCDECSDTKALTKFGEAGLGEYEGHWYCFHCWTKWRSNWSQQGFNSFAEYIAHRKARQEAMDASMGGVFGGRHGEYSQWTYQ